MPGELHDAGVNVGLAGVGVGAGDHQRAAARLGQVGRAGDVAAQRQRADVHEHGAGDVEVDQAAMYVLLAVRLSKVPPLRVRLSLTVIPPWSWRVPLGGHEGAGRASTVEALVAVRVHRDGVAGWCRRGPKLFWRLTTPPRTLVWAGVGVGPGHGQRCLRRRPWSSPGRRPVAASWMTPVTMVGAVFVIVRVSLRPARLTAAGERSPLLPPAMVTALVAERWRDEGGKWRWGGGGGGGGGEGGGGGGPRWSDRRRPRSPRR